MSTRSATTTDEGAGSEAGVHVEMSVEAPNCPIAEESRRSGEIKDVRRSTASSRDEMLIEEFRLEGDSEPEDSRMEKAFDLPESSVYRLPRVKDRGCVCEVIESFNCVVSEVDAVDGCLQVSFYAPDVETVKEIKEVLEDAAGEVSLEQLTASARGSSDEMVLVHGGRLTGRQKEVVRTAYEMGYFDYPKQANASEVADSLGIATSTFTEHVSAAETKLLEPFCTE